MAVDQGRRSGAATSAKERIRSARARWAWFDHAVRTYDRNNEVLGRQLAGAITYLAFLSFFPLLALAFSLVGYISDSFPNAQQAVTDAVSEFFPSLIGPGPGRIDIQDVIAPKADPPIIAPGVSPPRG